MIGLDILSCINCLFLFLKYYLEGCMINLSRLIYLF